MAAVSASPSGFSYAQAAKGQSSVGGSQAASSKVTSGAASPLARGNPLELGSSRNWADDVELSVGEKAREVQEVSHENSRPAEAKSGTVERAKSEEKAQKGSSEVSSPDLAASATSHDSIPTQNGSSQTSWETKSESSEPAWIAERKERQSSTQVTETAPKGKKKPEEAAPKPAQLVEASAPSVNPWAKRAEQNKARVAAMQQTATPAAAVPGTSGSPMKENQRPRAETRKKASSVTDLPRESGATHSPAGVQSKRAIETRDSPLPTYKSNAANSRPNTASSVFVRSTHAERQSLPNLIAVPPPSQDQRSWPTPDIALENERKSAPEKDIAQEKDGDSASAAKPRKKPDWKHYAVTPNVIWETEEMNRAKSSRGGFGTERGGRGGSLRGRGGARGALSGVSGNERGVTRGSSTDDTSSITRRGRSDATDRGAMPPPAKPPRASSASSLRGQASDSLMDRKSKAYSFTDKSKNASDSTAALQNGSAVSEGATDSFSSQPRTKSPPKMDSPAPGSEDEVKMPQPIPRRIPVGTETQAPVTTPDAQSGDAPPIRKVPSESRKEPRAGEGFKDTDWNPQPRGSKRNGRGRGGSREFVNGHQAPHPSANGHPADFASASPYAVPPASSSYQTSRGSHQGSYQETGRGTWRSGHPRAQSIPVDNSFYFRYGGAYAGHPSQPLSVQTYMPGIYEFSGYPMSAVAYSQLADRNHLMDSVAYQVEYYFSMDNMLKDVFLRKNMDSQGFVLLDVIVAFNRIKQLTQDKELIRAVCLASTIIEIMVGEDGNERLRKREGWEQFVMPKEERFPSAQNDGPSQLQRPEPPEMQNYGSGLTSQRGPSSAGLPYTLQRPGEHRSFGDAYAMNGLSPQAAFFPGMADAVYSEMLNGEVLRGRATKSPMRETSVSPTQQTPSASGAEKDFEPDAFPEQQIEQLTVVVKVNQNRVPFHNAASRTFSNGSIDSRSTFGGVEGRSDGQSHAATNGDTAANGDTSPSISRRASPFGLRSPDQPNEISLFWIKDAEKPVESLPTDVTPEPYVQLRTKALDQRNHAATGTCPYDLDVLYQFWSHFLIRNFNNRMYTEFSYYANADAKERHSFTGQQNLIKYYDQALTSQNPIPSRVVKDYVELVKSNAPKQDNLGFKQLRAAWRNGALNLRNRKKLADIVDQPLKELLEG